ncbi:MAG: Athe_2463 domain-containing protein, partial [Desulfotomaculales bacterium]
MCLRKVLGSILLVFFLAFPLFSRSWVTAAFAGPNLQEMLRILRQSESIVVSGKTVSARLDRNQIVYGWPWDVPDNDWKKAPTSWQEDNGVNAGKPGQEPRYLGYTFEGELYTNDWFPIDAPNQVAPARRDMRTLAQVGVEGNKDRVSDYTWGVIQSVLARYHRAIGFENDINSFIMNPSFLWPRGSFREETLTKYFKILSEPRPGVTGAVRHWHYRKDLGGIYYDTISIQWDVLPDFIVESIDPGTTKAKPGETYHG